MKKLLIGILVLSLLFSLSFADFTEPKVRVALVQEMNSDNLIGVKFDSEHSITLGDVELSNIAEGQKYTVGIFDEELYVTRSYAESHFDWDEEMMSEYYPLFTKDGVQLFSLDEPTIMPDEFYRDRVRGAGFYVDGDLAFIITYSRITINPTDIGYFSIGGYKFRDSFSAYVHVKNKLYPINEAGIENYLYGVVPSEMPASWQKEALKAQAVCARTYAYNKVLMGEPNYDLVSNTADQMYRGINVEMSSSNTAVDETRGVIATYNSQPIGAFFSSSNGGYTASSLETWGSNIPYLIAKPDEYDERADYHWVTKLTKEYLSDVFNDMGLNIGDVIKMTVLDRTSGSGRVKSLSILGTEGEEVISDSSIRKRLGYGKVKSRIFTIENSGASEEYVLNADGSMDVLDEDFTVLTADGEKTGNLFNKVLTSSGLETLFEDVDSKEIVLKGKGYGHGVGMSQYGANQMAKEGFTYENILRFYYEGIDLEIY